MMNRTFTRAAAMITAAALSGLAAQPSIAQYGGPNQDRGFDSQNQNRDAGPPGQDQSRNRANQYDDGYRTGYRAGYETARNRRRYDDRPVAQRDDRGDPNNRWRQRYSQTYSYGDDAYYRDCRSSSDPGGVMAGALIGGLLGNTISRGNGGATVAGVIIGGATGAAMIRNLNCEDRSYAYKTYYDGFNSGRPNSTYRWRNPGNSHHGEFRVGNYYTDPDSFRCATYSQQIYIDGRPQAMSGRACQQPDGSWAIVG